MSERNNVIYFIVYERYAEYNQFEGQWFTEVRPFTDKDKAITYKEVLKKDKFNNYRSILGPLIEIGANYKKEGQEYICNSCGHVIGKILSGDLEETQQQIDIALQRRKKK